MSFHLQTPLILRGVHDAPEEDTANNLRKSRLIDALEALESQLKKTRFIIGRSLLLILTIVTAPTCDSSVHGTGACSGVQPRL